MLARTFTRFTGEVPTRTMRTASNSSATDWSPVKGKEIMAWMRTPAMPVPTGPMGPYVLILTEQLLVKWCPEPRRRLTEATFT
jgi:hypothetical protein